MKTLKQFYKQEVKNISANLKIAKPLFRELQSLNSRGLSETPEFTTKTQQLNKLVKGGWVNEERVEARYLYLAYAVIRNKSLALVEPQLGFSESKLKRKVEEMEKQYIKTLNNI